MKTGSYCLLMLLLFSCASAKENNYTASTPADTVVRKFLGISLQDSVDFIRWQLNMQPDRYTLNCNYGISKPNTNGFMDGGKTINVSGKWDKEGDLYLLHNGDRALQIAELNTDLLHIKDNRGLLIGNGGWSYTLNNVAPVNTDELNVIATSNELRDSMAFQGRTPCNVPGVIPDGAVCYKIKWYIMLYVDATKPGAGTYKILATNWRKHGGKTGKWQAKKGKGGRITYELYAEQEAPFIYLVKASDNVLVFCDAAGKLLIGNKDFSYTMNSVLH